MWPAVLRKHQHIIVSFLTTEKVQTQIDFHDITYEVLKVRVVITGISQIGKKQLRNFVSTHFNSGKSQCNLTK